MEASAAPVNKHVLCYMQVRSDADSALNVIGGNSHIHLEGDLA